MSSKNYDVEMMAPYDNNYRHYFPTYSVYFPPYAGRSYFSYDAYISFDDESEQNLKYSYPSNFVWSDQAGVTIDFSGVCSKVYFRNPHRDKVTFNDYVDQNCGVRIIYQAKARFETQFNSTGFAANSNPWFICSTIQKNTYKQYEWVSATVYYKKSTDLTYQSAAGTVSGSWSNVRIDTNITLQDGYTYDIYIRAVADDNSTANTPVAQFTTTDAAAVATCLAPVGAFTNGEATFVWSHSTEYGTPQYAFDLQYSINNGSSWTTVESHKVTSNTSETVTLTDAAVIKWRVRTYNSNDVVGEWAEASFVNNMPATPPTSISVNTKGRPTVTWAAATQSAYEIQFLSNDTVVYDSGAVYSTQMSHFVNKYFDDNRSYTVRLRIYNALGEVSEWVETGYQQENVTDVEFTVTSNEEGGAIITVVPHNDFAKYYVLRDNKPIAEMSGTTYTDVYAIGLENYSVVGVTSADQSDIQTKGFRVKYPHAKIVALNGQQLSVNKRVNSAYEVQTSNEASMNKADFIGDESPTHFPSNMRLKSFSITCFDDQEICEDLLGQVVFYADNFGNGGYCMVKSYSKTDNFIQNSGGIYANEVNLTLEVTNYDDSIEYPL